MPVFSGIVERVGTVERAVPEPGSLRLAIRAGFDRDPDAGESVAVNGVCLTVERASGGLFEAVAVGETLSRTTLAGLTPGRRVNLERALRIGDPLGGHWVQGHVDGVGAVRRVTREGGGVRLEIEIPPALRRYVAEKGSLAVDGVSLTVAAWDEPVLAVALAPFTLANTTASEYATGSAVHLEADIVARYLERLLEARGAPGEAGSFAPSGRNR